jgi:hypothetical protein
MNYKIKHIKWADPALYIVRRSIVPFNRTGCTYRVSQVRFVVRVTLILKYNNTHGCMIYVRVPARKKFDLKTLSSVAAERILRVLNDFILKKKKKVLRMIIILRLLVAIQNYRFIKYTQYRGNYD